MKWSVGWIFVADFRFDCWGEKPDSSVALQSCSVSFSTRYVCQWQEMM